MNHIFKASGKEVKAMQLLPSYLACSKSPHQNQDLKEPDDLQQTRTGLGLRSSMPNASANKPFFQGSCVSSSASLG